MHAMDAADRARTPLTEPGAPRPLLLTIPQASHLLGKSRSSIYEMVNKGEIPGVVRLGKSIRIRYADLERWVEGMATKTAA